MKKTSVLALHLVSGLVTGLVVWASLFSQVTAAVVYVDPNGIIQTAINNAANGDVIIVSSGTYEENINFSDKAITLKSADPNDPAVVAATIIDGGGKGRVVTFMSGQGTVSVLNGFTLQNGSASKGGGIYCASSSSLITNGIIRDNTASSGSSDINDGGGGIYCDSSPTITNCTIIGNKSSAYGGGIYCHSYSHLLLTDDH